MKLRGYKWVASILFVFHASGCAELGTTLSAVAESMSECVRWEASYAGSDPDTGEYVVDTFFSYEDETAAEESWVTDRTYYYLDYVGTGSYYETSPITDISYRFDVWCTEFANNTGYYY